MHYNICHKFTCNSWLVKNTYDCKVCLLPQIQDNAFSWLQMCKFMKLTLLFVVIQHVLEILVFMSVWQTKAHVWSYDHVSHKTIGFFSLSLLEMGNIWDLVKRNHYILPFILYCLLPAHKELTVGHIDNGFTTLYQLRLYKESKRIFDIISCAKPIDRFPCQVSFLVVTEIL